MPELNVTPSAKAYHAHPGPTHRAMMIGVGCYIKVGVAPRLYGGRNSLDLGKYMQTARKVRALRDTDKNIATHITTFGRPLAV